ncbi:MAG: energy transducer TonB [Pseudomonadota bacterium]
MKYAMMAGEGFLKRRKRPRWQVLVLIVLAHIVLLYALGRVFAPDMTASVERSVVSAFTVTVTAPAEPTPEATPEPDEGAQGDPGRRATPSEVTAPKPPTPIATPTPRPQASSTGAANNSGARHAGDGTGAAGQGPGTGSGRGGSGQGNGIATGPSVQSGNLNIARDFPVPEGGRSTRFGKSVTVVFTVTTEGRARNCSVARSEVDAETTSRVCDLVAQKIRFNPAMTRDGRPVEARYGYRVDFKPR